MNTLNRKQILLVIPALLLAFSSAALAERPFAQPGADAAMITGAQGRPAADIFPVRFVEIDGENIGSREVFWLKPGKYELKVQPRMRNIGGLQTMRGRVREDRDINVIEVVVEAGKSYYIGARSNPLDRRVPYTPVLYRVDDSE